MDLTLLEETRKLAIDGLVKMVTENKTYLDNFSRGKYEDAFKAFVKENEDAISAITEVVQYTEDKKSWGADLAKEAAKVCASKMEGLKKQKKMDTQIGYNMVLIAYVLPAILDTRADDAETIADSFVASWNKELKQSIGKATHEEIKAGFVHKWCYITTAVCEYQGKADDCYELNLLRDYRDDYLLSDSESRKLVEEYYDIAPTIVHHIDRREDSSEIYDEIWEKYLQPCIRMIEADEKENCKKCYVDMVHDLKEKYFM